MQVNCDKKNVIKKLWTAQSPLNTPLGPRQGPDIYYPQFLIIRFQFITISL